MKVRAVTMFLPDRLTPQRVHEAARSLHALADALRNAHYEVQSVRIALGTWDVSDLGQMSSHERARTLREIHDVLVNQRVDDLGLGLIHQPDDLEGLPELLAISPRFYTASNTWSHPASRSSSAQQATLMASAQLMLQLAKNNGGFANFQFAAGFGVRPETPFFPVAYHQLPAQAQPTIGLAFENSDVVVEAFAVGGPTLTGGLQRLHERFTQLYQPACHVMQDMCERLGCRFVGIDTSIAPGIRPEESLVPAFRSLGVTLGGAGTTTICAGITATIKSLPVPQTGYCGLMLSLMEDHGLASDPAVLRLDAQRFLQYSAVCGTGIDMVPIAGDVSHAELTRLLEDVATLAHRWDKPLSVRCLPIPGKRVGELTEFDSPYVVNTPIRAL